jgi:hypothetical protein
VGTASAHDSAAIATALLSGMHLVFVVAAIVGLAGVVCAFAREERPLSTQQH